MVHTETVTLSEFLLARIEEDGGFRVRLLRDQAEVARCGGCDAVADSLLGEVALVEREREAKRRIVELHQSWGYVEERSYADNVLRLLALPHADHPDYREEWKP